VAFPQNPCFHPLQDKDGHNDALTAWIDLSFLGMDSTWGHGEPYIDPLLDMTFLDLIPFLAQARSAFYPTYGLLADDVKIDYTEYGIPREHFEDALKSRDETWNVLSRFKTAYPDLF